MAYAARRVAGTRLLWCGLKNEHCEVDDGTRATVDEKRKRLSLCAEKHTFGIKITKIVKQKVEIIQMTSFRR